MKRIVSLILLVIAMVTVLALSGCDAVSGIFGKDEEEHVHSFTKENTDGAYLAVGADCIKSAEYYYSCECGEKGEETFTVGVPLGHTYGEGKVTLPSCTTVGFTEYTCSCGNIKIDSEVAPLGHSYDGVKVIAPTCTAGGYTEYTCHCGDVKIENATAATGHKHEVSEKIAPTCTAAGSVIYTCLCGDVKIETVSAKGHSYTDYKSNGDATCYADGTKTAFCDHECGESETVIDVGSAGHIWENDLCHGCGVAYYSQGLAYTLTEGGNSYFVSGLGSCLDLIIVIPSEIQGLPVVGIGSGAFSGVGTIKEVVMPDSITYVGDNAFYLCIQIEIIFLSKNVTSIGDSAFMGCESLDKITIPDSVTNIGNSAFKGCTGLEKIVIPDSVTEIGNFAFEGCSSLSSVILGIGIEKIGDRAFYLCIKITIIIIPEGVSYVGSNAFGGCDALKYILTKLLEEAWALLEWAEDWLGSTEADTYLGDSWKEPAPDGEEDADVIIFGKWEVFKAASCTEDGSLRRYAINVPDYYEEEIVPALNHDIIYVGNQSPTCTEVGWESYEYCTRGDHTTYVEIPATGHSTIYVSPSAPNCTEEGHNGYNYCTKCGDNDKETIPALGHSYVSHDGKAPTCTEGGWTAYQTCNNCTLNTRELLSALGHKYENYVSNKDATCTADGTLTAVCENGCGEKHTKTDIGSEFGHKFENYVSNEDATCTADGTLTAVCENGCGEKHTKADEGTAFGHDLAYVDAKAPDCTNISWNAYEYCLRCDYSTYAEIKALGHSYDAEGVCSVCGNRVSVGLTYKLNSDGASYAVSGIGTCVDTYIIIPDVYEGLPVTRVASKAFYGKSTITGIKVPEGVTAIEAQAFAYCEILSSISLPNSLQSIESNAFSSTTNIVYNEYENAYYLGNSDNPHVVLVKAVNTGIASCEINANTKFILGSAFASCTRLIGISVPDNVISIGNDAFKSCTSMTSAVIGKGVTLLPLGLFSGCGKLQSLTIPFVGDSAKTVSEEYQYPLGYIFGTTSYTGSKTIQQTYYGKMASYGLLSTTYTTYYIPTSLTSVTVTGGDITYGSFHNCNTIVNITIDGDNTTVSNNAFLNCLGLKNLAIGEGITEIKGGALTGCGYLENLTIPFVGDKAIHDNTSAENRLFGFIFGTSWFTNSVSVQQYYNSNSYYKQTYCIPASLRTVTILGGSLGYGAFYNCNLITKVTFAGDIDVIGERAFYKCTALNTVEIFGKVNTCQSYAFEGCSYLRNVYTNSLENWINTEFKTFASNPLWNYGTLYVNGETLSGDIVIPDGVTYIGNYALYGCKDITSIVIPSSVTSLGFGVFSDCANLKSVTIPDGVTSISAYAFNNCTALTSVNLHEGITSIENYAFYGCTSLTSIEIPDGITSIGACAFYNCTALASVNLPDGIKDISNYTFGNCTSLTSIRIPLGVTTLGNYAFQDCTSLTSIEIPDGVTSIGAYAFNNCTALASVNLPDGITDISSYTFRNCTSLTSIRIPLGVTTLGECVFEGCSGLASIEIPNGVTSIGASAFKNCVGLTEIVIPATVTSIGYDSFAGLSYLEKITIPLVGAEASATTPSASTVFGYIFGKNSYENAVYTQQYYGSSYTYAYIPSTLKEVTVTGGSLLYGAFYGCNNITDIILLDGVTSVGTKAFEGCTSLKYNVYEGVNYLGNVANPYKVLVSATDDSVSCVIHENTEIIAGAAFNGKERLQSIVIPAGVKLIGTEAFYGCTSLMKVTNLSDITFTVGKTDNGYVSYYAKVVIDKDGNKTYASDITDFDFVDSPENCVFIRENGTYILIAYYGSEENVILPSSIGGNGYAIGADVFRDRTDIKSIVIPEGLTAIGNYAFYGCTALESINIPSGVLTIGDQALYGCSKLTTIVVPDSVTTIGNGAFAKCTGVKSVVIGKGVTQIGTSIMFGLSNLERLTVPFVGADVNATTASATTLFGYFFGTASFTNASQKQQYYSGNSYVNYYIPSKLNEVTVTGGNLLYGTFQNCSTIQKITLGDEVTRIENRVFTGCTYLSDVIIGDGVVTIGSGAFLSCGTIENLTIGRGLRSVDSDAFSSTYITNLHIDNIADWCRISFYHERSTPFSAITNLYVNDTLVTDLVIPEGITSMGTYTFAGFEQMNSVTICGTLTSIGNYAFYKCTSLKKVVIEEGVTTIGGYSFAYCKALTNVNIPNTVKVLGGGAFAYCTGLTNIEIPGSVTSMGQMSFAGCSALENMTIPFVGTAFPEINSYYHPFGIIFGTTEYTGAVATSQTYRSGTTSVTATYYIPASLKYVTVLGGNINYGAFENCKNILGVTLYEGLKVINDHGFYNSGIVSITIPSTVQSINDYAFYNCQNLLKVTNLSTLNITPGRGINGYVSAYAIVVIDKDGNEIYKDGVTSLEIFIEGDYVFAKENEEYVLVGYTGTAQAITLPDNINGNYYSIGDKAFNLKSDITSIVIPEGVKAIGSDAFYYCSGLTSISIPGSVSTIGSYAFYQCTGLRSITLNSGLKSIDRAAFAYCSALTSIYLPDGLTTIGESAFSDCRVLVSARIPGSVEVISKYAFYNGYKITSLTIEEGVLEIGESAFVQCKALTKLVVPNSVILIGKDAFAGCIALTNVTLPFIGQKLSPTRGEYMYPLGYIFGTTSYTNCEATSQTYYINGGTYTTTSYYIPKSLKTVTVTGGKLGYGAFYNCKNITNIQINEGVTEIGGMAFYNCKSLTKVNIPSTVTSLGSNIFDGCTSLSLSYYTYKNARYLGSDTNPYLVLYQADSTSITSCKIHSDTKIIYSGAFKNCTSLTSVEFNSELLEIGDNAFYGCTALTSVTIPDTVKNINDYTFHGCTALTSIILPDGIKKIGAYAFYRCLALETIELPDSITDIGTYAFSACGIRSIRIPLGVTYINSYTFKSCPNLTEIIWHDGVIGIGNYAFSSCASLTCVEIPGSIIAMGELAFGSNSALTTVIIHDGVTTIGYAVFAECSKLNTVILPATLTSIMDMAFYYSNNIKNVYYCGTSSQWSSISFSSYNTSLTNASRYYYSETDPGVTGVYWHYNENGEPEIW